MPMPEIRVEPSDVLPLCPHCEAELDHIKKVEHGVLEKHVIYICPHCRKILGIGNDREN